MSGKNVNFGDKKILKSNFYKNKKVIKAQKVQKQKAPCKCSSIKMLDSVVKAKKTHYSQTLLEESKYNQKS